MDVRSYLALEIGLKRRLQASWRKASTKAYTKIAQCVINHDWHGATMAVHDLDMTHIADDNAKYIEYVLRACAAYGGRRANKRSTNVLDHPSADELVRQSVSNIHQYFEHRATALVQAKALQLIARAERQHIEDQIGVSSTAKNDMVVADLVLGGKKNPQLGLPGVYVSRRLQNAQEFVQWAKSQGFDRVVTPEDLHVTIVYSRNPVQSVAPASPSLTCIGGPRTVEPLGNDGAVVLKFGSPALHHRWEVYRQAGASWDYPVYQSHITISYHSTLSPTELKAVQPFSGPLIFGSEVLEPLNPEFKDNVVEKGESVHTAAHAAATSPANPHPLPTEAQIEAGNYKKGHISVSGLDISVENPAGSHRRPEWPMLKAHYGYLKRTTGADGEHIDVFVKAHLQDDWQGTIWVIDQHVDGQFDEHKVMVGYDTEAEAREAYSENYTSDWQGLKHCTGMTLEQFKLWMASPQSEPVKKYDVQGHEFHGNQWTGGIGSTMAFHGSNADFAKFDTQRIDANNNGFFYGWGLYFATNEEVAQVYKKVGEGKIYTVALDIQPDQLVDWMKPLKEQPALWDLLRAQCGQHLADSSKDLDLKDKQNRTWLKYVKDGIKEIKSGELIGAQAYRWLSQTSTPERLAAIGETNSGIGWGERFASKFLDANGFHGITYPDATKNVEHKGTPNFVVFSDARVSITAKKVEDHTPVLSDDRGRYVLLQLQIGEITKYVKSYVHRNAEVKKADRFVTPFVSFQEEGDQLVQMISSLHTSRMSTWGFTAEATQLGVTRYKLTAVLDGRTCFAAGTMVQSSKLGVIAIDCIEPGDYVIGGSGSERKVLGTRKAVSSQWRDITFEEGIVVRATPNHPFWVVQPGGSGWVVVKDLVAGDCIGGVVVPPVREALYIPEVQAKEVLQSRVLGEVKRGWVGKARLPTLRTGVHHPKDLCGARGRLREVLLTTVQQDTPQRRYAERGDYVGVCDVQEAVFSTPGVYQERGERGALLERLPEEASPARVSDLSWEFQRDSEKYTGVLFQSLLRSVEFGDQTRGHGARGVTGAGVGVQAGDSRRKMVRGFPSGRLAGGRSGRGVLAFHRRTESRRPEEGSRVEGFGVSGNSLAGAESNGYHTSGVPEIDYGGFTPSPDFTLKIVSIVDIASEEYCYDLEVEQEACFLLGNGAVVHNSPFCRAIDGREFEVQQARSLVTEALSAQDPEDLKQIQPWPDQTRDAIAEYEAMTDEELVAEGLNIPPFHPGCRTMCTMIDDTTGEPPPKLEGDQQGQATAEDFQGLTDQITTEQLQQWNDYLGNAPQDMLDLLFGTAEKSGVDVQNSGDILMWAAGKLEDGAWDIQTVLDPFTSTLYLSQAEFAIQDTVAAAEFVSSVIDRMITTGQAVGLQSIALATGADAAEYAQMGFLPKPADWQEIRLKAIDDLYGDTPALGNVYNALDDDQKTMVLNLLSTPDEHALEALIDLDITVEGKTLGQWLLEGADYDFTLDLTDDLAVARAKEYLG